MSTPPHHGRRPPRGGVRRRLLQLPLLLFGADGACVLLVLSTVGHGQLGTGVFGVSLLFVHLVAGLYRPRLELSVLDDLPLLVGSSVASVGLASLVLGLLGVAAPDRRAFASLALLTGLVVALRTVTHALRRRARRTGRVGVRTLVVGCGGLGAQLAEVLSTGEHGLLPVGFVDDSPRLPPHERPLPILGTIADLRGIVTRNEIAVVLIAFSNAPEAVVVDVLRGCHGLDVEILTVPRFWQVSSTHRRCQVVRGIPLVQLRRPAFRAGTWPLKRVLDVVASAVGLVVLSPLLLACAVAVRVETGPGVLFRQVRVGLEGHRFELLKFRSLPEDHVDSATRWSVDGDDGMVPLGRWLRRLSLDELPQLWNVLRGDMSLVGPRPERPFFVERFTQQHEEYFWRLRVPCGITGWAQVHGLRGDTSISDRARYDNHYVENWTLWLDVKILLRTVLQVVTAAGR